MEFYDKTPELSFLTAPVNRNSPEFRIYPPQKGLHVLKQLGRGRIKMFLDADGMSTAQVHALRERYDPILTLAQFNITPLLTKVYQLKEKHLSVDDLRAEVEAAIPSLIRSTADASFKQKWRIFSGAGEVLERLESVWSNRILIVMDGGQWVWPVVKVRMSRMLLKHMNHPLIHHLELLLQVGHRQVVHGLRGKGESLVLETLAISPALFSVQGFLNPHECEHIINQAMPALEPATVHDDSLEDCRASSLAWVGGEDRPTDMTLELLRDNASILFKVERSHLEGALQVVSYKEVFGTQLRA